MRSSAAASTSSANDTIRPRKPNRTSGEGGLLQAGLGDGGNLGRIDQAQALLDDRGGLAGPKLGGSQLVTLRGQASIGPLELGVQHIELQLLETVRHLADVLLDDVGTQRFAGVGHGLLGRLDLRRQDVLGGLAPADLELDLLLDERGDRRGRRAAATSPERR